MEMFQKLSNKLSSFKGFPTILLLKLLVGALTCIEIFIMSINMSHLMHTILTPDHLPVKFALLLCIFVVIAIYVAFPLFMGMVIARTDIRGGRSTLWGSVILPIRLGTLIFLSLELGRFHYMIIPHILTTCATFIFYIFAIKARWYDLKPLKVVIGEPTIDYEKAKIAYPEDANQIAVPVTEI